MLKISPYISEGSGLKLGGRFLAAQFPKISPYISEGSGLKRGIGGPLPARTG